MKLTTIFVLGLMLSFATVGCVPAYYSLYERERASDVDTLQASAMTKGDIIALSKEGVSDEVIISQIKATASYFQLNTDDIIELKKAGVSEKVINVMIKSAEPRPVRQTARRYSYGYPSYYPYGIYSGYSGYYGYPWYYPGYSSIYPGFGYGYYRPYVSHFYTPYYGGHFGYSGFYGGGHFSGGYGYGGHRSFGGHR